MLQNKYWKATSRYTDEQIFFIADTHFYHSRMLNTRPYKTVSEMNEDLVTRWNNKVKFDSIIFVLGDFCVAGMFDTRDILSKLRGTKILLNGNHDLLNRQLYLKAGFSDVKKTLSIADEDIRLFCIHNPQWRPEDNPEGLKVLYGHLHNDYDLPYLKGKGLCVSVERPWMKYAPISLREVKQLLAAEEVV